VDNRVRELRTARGWSQQVLGEKVGVSRQTIIAIERSRYDPSLPLAFEMALIFDMKIEDLFQHRSES